MASILPRLRPETTTTLPGFSASMRASGSSLVWISSSQLVGSCERGVERGDAAEVGEQVGAEAGEDVDARRDAGVRLLLHQRGVEVSGVVGQQSNVRHAISTPAERVSGTRISTKTDCTGQETILSHRVASPIADPLLLLHRHHASSFLTTSPWTSVRRKSRPWNLNVSLV